jgi:hypothetical protein
MATEPPLFADLPDAVAPPYLYADEHVLEPCVPCGGTGRAENPYPYRHPRHWFWDPTCRSCNGVGKRLVFVGPVRDV